MKTTGHCEDCKKEKEGKLELKIGLKQKKGGEGDQPEKEDSLRRAMLCEG